MLRRNARRLGLQLDGQLGNNTTTDSSLPVAVATSTLPIGARFIKATSAQMALHSLGLVALPAPADPPLAVIFNSAADVPVTASGFSASGTYVNFTLNFAPPIGTALTVVNNTGLAFIKGSFTNLSQGQAVNLSFGGVTYNFVANYYGGTGNDLVLQWANNEVVTWGIDIKWPSLSPLYNDVPLPVDPSGVLAGRTIVSVAAGDTHALALCSDGTVAAWGRNQVGQLGNGSGADSRVPVAVTGGVLSGKQVIAVAAGADHSLALCSDGTVAAWGDNQAGQLGHGNTTASLVPAAVSTFGPLAGKIVVAISAGGEHSLALCADGTLVGWGANDLGQLGNNSTTSSLVPVAVTRSGVLAGKTVLSISAGHTHSLALCSDGTLVAWGFNGFGQLGTGNNTNSPVPVAVSTSGVLSGKTITAMAAGQEHSLAVCSDGTAATWGYNLQGQLGNGSNTNSLLPVAVSTAGMLAGRAVVTVAGGAQHSLALCSDGTLAAWGSNGFGTLGDNTTTDSNVPVSTILDALPPGSRFIVGTTGLDSHFSLGIVGLRVSPAVDAQAPHLTVQQPAGSTVLSGLDSRDFGTVGPGNSATLVFTLKNTGGAPLHLFGFVLDGPDTQDFILTKFTATSLAPGRLTTCSITFKPSATGSRSATLEVASDDPDRNPFLLNFTGTGTGPDITTQPASVMVGLGQPAALTVVASSDSTLSYQWLKNGKPVPFATGSGYPLVAAALANAGVYTVKVSDAGGAFTSAAANLGVVDQTPASITVATGGTLTFTASAAGPGLTYQWLKNGVALFNGSNAHHAGTISGATSTKLSITQATPADAAGYTCLVTMPDPQNPGSSFSLATGVWTAHVGFLTPVSGHVTPSALPTWAGNGSFSGLVAPDAALNGGYGGGFNLTATTTGIFTGRLLLGSVIYVFTGQYDDGSLSATVDIPRTGLTDLTLAFTVNRDTGELTGSVTDGVIATLVAVEAWCNPWSAVSNPSPFAAIYTCGLNLDAALVGNLAYPQGTGFSTLTVTSGGTVTNITKLADGSAAASFGTMGSSGAVPMHAMLYNNTGSLHGWITASFDNLVTPANNGLRLLDGSLAWQKSPGTLPTDRSYKAGIPLNTLTVAGGEYVRPTVGSRALGLANTANNAALVFSGANIESAAAYSSAGLNNFVFTISSINIVTLPPAAANPAGLSLTLSAPTGTFSGTFHLAGDADVTHSGVLLSRLVSYSGLLVPRLSVNQGVGFFLLAQLPTAGPPATTISTSPILSGNVVLKAATQK